MIAFIDDHRAVHGVEPICRLLPIAPSKYRARAATRRDLSKRSARARRDLLLHSFDPIQARAVGLSVGLLHFGLLSLLSLTIVATLSAVGIILSIGLLIAPGAIALLERLAVGDTRREICRCLRLS